MRPKTPQLTADDTREERETKLKTFIAAHLDQTGVEVVSLLARAPSSPSARALQAQSAELAARGIRAEIILAGAATAVADETWSLVFDAALVHEIRIATNPRLLDGHEQLIIGSHTVWYGDSMRRDPAKRDAYERYHLGDAEAARVARWTFARLWSTAQPIYGNAAIASITRARVRPQLTLPMQAAQETPAQALAPPSAIRETVEPASVAETLSAWRPPTRH
jgi:hypothetical protein